MGDLVLMPNQLLAPYSQHLLAIGIPPASSQNPPCTFQQGHLTNNMRGRKPEDIWTRLFSKVVVDTTPKSKDDKFKLFLQGIEANAMDCWIFTGAKSIKGYGLISFQGKIQKAHRVSAYLFGKLDIRLGNQINHKCDNPACVHPGHYYVSNQANNLKDWRDTPAERFSRMLDYKEKLSNLEPIDDTRERALTILMKKMGLLK